MLRCRSRNFKDYFFRCRIHHGKQGVAAQKFSVDQHLVLFDRRGRFCNRGHMKTSSTNRADPAPASLSAGPAFAAISPQLVSNPPQMHLNPKTTEKTEKQP